MAEIVLALATSHGPMLGSTADDILRHGERDRNNPALLDRDGRPVAFDDLLKTSDPAIADELAPAVINARVETCQSAIARMADVLAQVRPDVVIVVGDDQKEQFLDDNQPAILIYGGAEIENTVSPLPRTAPDYWKRARAQYHEEDGPRSYPVAAGLARHLTASLVAGGFDISHSERLPRPRGEGHAFAFVHKRLMTGFVTPIVPIMLNTYHPPNQPTPQRCVALGQGLAAAVGSWPEDMKVAFVASGGLSHFTVDADLDRMVMTAFLSGDTDALGGIDPARLNSGSSEIRNWITVGAAAAGLQASWESYTPFYRTTAGTGCGMGFAMLRNGAPN